MSLSDSSVMQRVYEALQTDGKIRSKYFTYGDFQKTLAAVAEIVKKDIRPDLPGKGDSEGLVTYHVVRVIPFESLKPEVLTETKTSDGDNIQILTHPMEYLVQFDCYALTNQDAEDMAEDLQEFIATYTGVFKYFGVRELTFEERLIDGTVTNPQKVVTRSVRFRVIIANIYIIPVDIIGDITVTIEQSNIYDDSNERF